MAWAIRYRLGCEFLFKDKLTLEGRYSAALDYAQ
jgi:hypothetical protein